MKKKAFFCISIFVLVIVILQSLSIASDHVYINGRLTNFSSTTISIDNKTYMFSYKVKFLKHIKKKQSIYEEPATLKEARIGDFVTIKVRDNLVEEVIIEVYRR